MIGDKLCRMLLFRKVARMVDDPMPPPQENELLIDLIYPCRNLPLVKKYSTDSNIKSLGYVFPYDDYGLSSKNIVSGPPGRLPIQVE